MNLNPLQRGILFVALALFAISIVVAPRRMAGISGSPVFWGPVWDADVPEMMRLDYTLSSIRRGEGYVSSASLTSEVVPGLLGLIWGGIAFVTLAAVMLTQGVELPSPTSEPSPDSRPLETFVAGGTTQRVQMLVGLTILAALVAFALVAT